MTANDEFLALVERAFPEEPIPHRLLWKNTEDRLDRSIHEDISRTFARRCWKDLSILDWQMMGAPPIIIRCYFEPIAFIYYLPSLFIGTIQDTKYIEFALEAIIPDNKLHIPLGEWWSEFSKSISPIQRKTLFEFLAQKRLESGMKSG